MRRKSARPPPTATASTALFEKGGDGSTSSDGAHAEAPAGGSSSNGNGATPLEEQPSTSGRGAGQESRAGVRGAHVQVRTPEGWGSPD